MMRSGSECACGRWQQLKCEVCFCSDPDGHVAAEGEEEPELSGAVRPTAGVLSGVRHGEDQHACLCEAGSPGHNLLSVSDPGGRSGLWSLCPVQPRHPSAAGVSSSHQHVRLLPGRK